MDAVDSKPPPINVPVPEEDAAAEATVEPLSLTVAFPEVGVVHSNFGEETAVIKIVF